MTALVLLPSFQRAHLLKDFLDSYRATEATIPGLVLVDKLDPQLEAYQALEYPPGWELVLTLGRSMASKCLEVWDRYKDLDAVMICNDDHYCITPHWDEKILAQVTGTNIIGTNDNWVAPNRLCGMTAFSGNVIRTLGYLFPPGIEHLFIDNCWEFLAAKAQCAQILMDVVIEHRHVFKDPATPKDETHTSVYTEGWNDAGKEGSPAWHFKKWMETSGEKDALKLLQLQPKQGLMIATPSHDGTVAMGYALGLADICAHLSVHNVYFELARVIGSSLIPHARNSLVDMFLKSKCQKLLFIDSDQGYDKTSILHLFQSNKRIIAAITPHKRFPINLNFEPLPKDAHYFKDLTNKGPDEFNVYAKALMDPKGEIEVNRVGTGMVMIDRSVFEIMKAKVESYQPFDNRNDVLHYEFFAMGAIPTPENINKRYRGEDWRFCELAKELKIPLYINANSVISHSGSYLFNVNPNVA